MEPQCLIVELRALGSGTRPQTLRLRDLAYCGHYAFACHQSQPLLRAISLSAFAA